MIVNTDIPVTRTDELPRHSHVYLSFLLIVNRSIESYVLEIRSRDDYTTLDLTK